MRVKHLSLTNFRGFERLELDLDRPVTVLVGVNGSGKTSVLRAICAAQNWLLSIYEQRRKLSGVSLDGRDLKLGAERGEIISSAHNGAMAFGFRVSWSTTELRWNADFLDSNHWIYLHSQPFKPFMFLVSVDRHVGAADVRHTRDTFATTHRDSPNESSETRSIEDVGAVAPQPGYARFIEWFKEREDTENERRVAARDFNLQDPQLRAVREAVVEVIPGIENLRIRRDPSPAMVATKGDAELRLDQLSDGERNLVALAGDLARRMVIANPTSDAPRETEGVILIDEIEQHLHPGLQRKVIPALQRAFPNAQFIVTTHSPQVLSSVPASAVVVLDGFSATPVTAPTQGRDTNAILREVFGVTDRPQEERAELLAIAALIDDDQLDEARTRLASLAEKLSERDDDVLRLRTKLDFAEAGL